jgi:hypothetical protein
VSEESGVRKEKSINTIFLVRKLGFLTKQKVSKCQVHNDRINLLLYLREVCC